MTVEASGFQTVTFEAVQVETNARLPLDVKFASIATSTASVTITSESAPLVESETSVRGDLITGGKSPIFRSRNETLPCSRDCLRA